MSDSDNDWSTCFVLIAVLVSLSLLFLCSYTETHPQAETSSLSGALSSSSSSPIVPARDEYNVLPQPPRLRNLRRSKRLHSKTQVGTQREADVQREISSTEDDLDTQSMSVTHVCSILWHQLQSREGLVTLLVIFTYKTGEAVSDSMLKPFLLDTGFNKSEIARWTGLYGMCFSTAGSLFAGFVVRAISDDRRKSALTPNGAILYAVACASAVECIAQIGRLVFASVDPALLLSSNGQWGFLTLICYESFSGGMLTTIIFTYMMASVDHTISATHYTAYSTVELLGKSIPSLCSGKIADTLGYQALFAIGAACSVSFATFSWSVCRLSSSTHHRKTS